MIDPMVAPLADFLRYGMVSGRWRGGVSAILGNGYGFSENIVLGGSKKEYCEYGAATRILCWVYDVLDDFYQTRLSGLMGSEADSRAGNPCSLPRRRDPQFSYCGASLKKQGGRYRRTNFAFWVSGSFLSAGRWV